MENPKPNYFEQDAEEIWWLETIGGHHWMARKVPDDVYVIMPNQLGIDQFNLEDAFSEQKEYMCSADLKDFIEKYHLNLAMDGVLNPRDAFGSHDDSDHVYNTPRAWYMGRCLNPHTWRWDGCEICSLFSFPGNLLRPLCRIRREQYAWCLPFYRY